MRLLTFPWVLPLAFFQLLLLFVRTNSRCLDDQSSSLLQLKSTLLYPTSRKLASWNRTTDCCSWEGVTCDQDEAHVTGLDLGGPFIRGGIDSSSTLFDLCYLQRLSLASNIDMSYADEIPNMPVSYAAVAMTVSHSVLIPNMPVSPYEFEISSEFGRLCNLTSLTLLGFAGQVPIEISRLTSLVSLSLSSAARHTLKLQNPDLKMLVGNLSRLIGLYLYEVDISANRTEWSQALSSALPRLQVLNMSSCSLSGPPDASLLKLRSLSQIHLDGNNISQVPEFFTNFSRLITLSLSDCGLTGKFPERIFQLSTLRDLDLSFNPDLQGSLPEFPHNGSLETLKITYTSFSGKLPESIGNLKLLRGLDLNSCNFSGSIPFFSKNSLQNLVYLDLHNNSFSGTIPPSLFALPSLKMLDLSNNQLTGQLCELSNASSSPLESLDLSGNNLVGPIPNSVFYLRNLSELDLSYNELSFNANSDNSTFSSLQIHSFRLVSCNLNTIPAILKDQTHLNHLDLSNNQIHGLIPNWIWKSNLMCLNLSYNFLVSLELPFLDLRSSLMLVLDLHNNMLQGLITPLLQPSTQFLDLSNNNFTSEIPTNISSYLSYTSFLSLAGNKFVGEIPASICNATFLEVLDLSSNNLSGQIPQCLGRMDTLAVLSLRRNKFTGIIPQKFSSRCSLQTLDLTGNMLGGQLPRSLVKCNVLEVLNIGNNQIYDTFPLWLGNLPYLQVIVLRFNRFYGTFGFAGTNNEFPMLKIIDLSSNNFTGILSPKCFLSWKGMVVDGDESQSKLKPDILKYDSDHGYYQDSVIISVKGQEMELVKILTVFSSLDLSSNRFQGEIPEVIGNLTFLHVLNFSHNSFTGEIPSSIGNLKQLESLDLSRNKLKGKIPMELVKLTFLSVLNVSWNQLVGMIPQANQFPTFPNDSFIGNVGLCGLPLSKKCVGATPPPTSMSEDSNSKSHKKFDWWQFLSAGIGYIAGAGLVFVSLVLWKKGKKWYDEHIDKCF